jgi:cystathionine beta-lyase/cystathionine gamma-synthase
MMLLGGDEAAPVAVVTANQPYLMFARERLRFFRDHGGAGAADAAAYGTLQALVDAGLRAAQKSATATALATALASHPAVRRVDYPGLPSHPDHHLLQRDWQAADGKLTVLLDRDLAATTAVVAHLQAAGLATAAAPGFLTQIDHLAAGRQQIPAPLRAEMGLDDGLLVITVGLEPAAQICAAVDRALAAE